MKFLPVRPEKAKQRGHLPPVQEKSGQERAGLRRRAASLDEFPLLQNAPPSQDRPRRGVDESDSRRCSTAQTEAPAQCENCFPCPSAEDSVRRPRKSARCQISPHVPSPARLKRKKVFVRSFRRTTPRNAACRRES